MFGINISLNLSKTIKTPKSHFIESIKIEGKKVTVKMKGHESLYHYEPSDAVIAIIKTADNESYGRIYNQYLKGHSVSKTVYEAPKETATI